MQQLIPQVSRGANLLGKGGKVHCHTHCLSWLSWWKQTSTCQFCCRYTRAAKILFYKTQINILPQQNWRDNTERASNEKEMVHHNLVLSNCIYETPICSFLWKKINVFFTLWRQTFLRTQYRNSQGEGKHCCSDRSAFSFKKSRPEHLHLCTCSCNDCAPSQVFLILLGICMCLQSSPCDGCYKHVLQKWDLFRCPRCRQLSPS